MRKLLYAFFIVLFIHFTIITIYLLSNIFYLDKAFKVTSCYVIPLFEQTWGMFSRPPKADVIILFKYKIERKNKAPVFTRWQDVSAPAVKRGLLLVSGDQRISKYLDGCVGNILEENNKAWDRYPLKRDVKKRHLFLQKLMRTSSGYQSLKEYSKAVLSKLGLKVTPVHKVSFRLKLIYDEFPDFERRDLDFFDKKNHKVSELNINYEYLN